MSINELKAWAEATLSKLNSGKMFLLDDVNARVQQVKDEYPQDTVIQAFASVIERMTQKNSGSPISQGDLEQVYQQLIGLNASGTQFRKVLGDLILSPEPGSINVNQDFVNLHRASENEPISLDIDQVLTSELNSVIDPQAQRSYSPQLASKAREKVALELKSLGFDNHRVHITTGNADVLVFAADLDTVSGPVRVLIPTEASGDQMPTVFVAGNRFEKLTHANLQAYLDESTGTNIRLQDPNSNMPEIKMPKVETPEELKSIAADLDEEVIETAISYPQASIRLAKQMIVAELGSMGFKGSQIRISAPTTDGFICETTLNTPQGKVTIEVPVEMHNNQPLMPSVFAKDDFVAEFNAANLHSLTKVDSNMNDSVVNRTSPLMSLNIGQLKEIILKGAIKGDFDTCDEVLEVISARFDEDTYKTTVMDYQKMLTNLKEAQDTLNQSYEDSDQFVKTPNSLYPIHKKLGRPAHELIKDENGEYQLKSTYYARKNQTEEGAFFSTAKVLVGD